MLLILDDLSIFSMLGCCPGKALRSLQKLRKKLSDDSLTLFAFHNRDFTSFTNHFNFTIDVSLIGTGFSKGVTGKVGFINKLKFSTYF